MVIKFSTQPLLTPPQNYQESTQVSFSFRMDSPNLSSSHTFSSYVCQDIFAANSTEEMPFPNIQQPSPAFTCNALMPNKEVRLLLYSLADSRVS